MSHTLVAENNRKKKRFEKMFLEGRPPVNLGVTSSGDVFGGTAITFGDVLGDQQFNVFASSIAQYRSLRVSYTNLSRRFQFSLQGSRRRSSSTVRSKASSTIRRSRRSSAAIRRSRRGRPRAAARSPSIRSTATAGSSCRRGSTT